MTGRGPARQAVTTDETSKLGFATGAILVSFLSLCLLATGAAAQYTVLGGGATSVPDEEALRSNVEAARWSAGPFRLQPWIGLRDVSYVRQQQSVSGSEAEDQLTVTVGAGLRAYSQLGPKVIWAAHLLPEYVWWQDDSAKDGLNGRYGMGFFGYANRLQFQVFHRLEEQQDFFSDEIQELTTTTTATSQVGAELKVVRGIHVYGSWERLEFEGDGDDSALFTLLDRTEDSWSAGIRLRSHRGWSLGVGVRHTEGEFDPAARDLSFEADSVTLDLGATLGRFDVTLRLEDADIEPRPGSTLEPRQQTFGNFDVAWKAGQRVSFEGYALRQRTFSIAETRSLIVRDEQGLRTEFSWNAWNLRLLVGQGGLESEVVGSAVDQSDDYDVYGATLGFRIRRLGAIQLNVIERQYDVGLLGGDRDVTSFGVSVQLGELAQRLSLGESSSLW
ncbi:MAG: hypothetical protein MPN21_01315 [Thermoanaerobaculia bacterium]|nr:hypothetical protein [Thermoanaerobaculia bacterium]